MEGKSTPYDSDYPRKLTARRIYDEEVPPRKPDNFNEWDMAIRRSRLSASPPESEYYAFARNVRLYGNERTVQLDFPYFADLGRFPPDSIHGRTADLLWKDHVQINPIKSEPISKPQPDYVEGLTEDAVPFRVQNELQYNIQPTDKGPVLPNLTAELKATSGDMVKSRHQSRHAGAVCAQGFLEYDSKFRPNEKSFGKASVASIQYNAELVKGKLHWPVQGSDERGDPCSSTTEYHMTPLFAGMPIESYDDYKRAKRSVKNLMEQCQEVREQYHAHMHNLPPPGLPGGPQPLRGPETAAADYLPHTVVPSTALTPNTSNSSFTASNSSSGLHPSGQSATSPEQGPLADDLAAVHQAQSSVIQDGRVQEPEDTDSRNLAAGATSTKPRNREPVQKPRSRASRRKQNEIVQPSHIDHLAPSGPRRSSARLSSSRRGQR